MKTLNNAFFIPLFFCFFSILSTTISFAQNCTGCTVTINGVDNTPRYVTPGAKICITSTGDMQGALYLIGGQVCNEGLISSNDVAMSSGTLTNYGLVDVNNFGASGGSLINDFNLVIDSLGMAGSNINFTNNGTATIRDLGLSGLGTGVNRRFNNNGVLYVDSLALSNMVSTNPGDLTVFYDFAHNQTASTFSNTGYMSVGRDFANTGNFYTACMISVGNDWANYGIVRGPLGAAGCGGFSVANNSANSGSYGVDNSNVDFCDATGGGFDGNTGTLGTNVTHCVCSGQCQITGTVSIEPIEKNIQIVPNPFSNMATMFFDNEDNEPHTFMLYDARGQLLKVLENITDNNIRIERGNLAQGLYFCQLLTANSKSNPIAFIIN